MTKRAAIDLDEGLTNMSLESSVSKLDGDIAERPKSKNSLLGLLSFENFLLV